MHVLEDCGFILTVQRTEAVPATSQHLTTSVRDTAKLDRLSAAPAPGSSRCPSSVTSPSNNSLTAANVITAFQDEGRGLVSLSAADQDRSQGSGAPAGPHRDVAPTGSFRQGCSCSSRHLSNFLSVTSLRALGTMSAHPGPPRVSPFVKVR